MEQSKIISVDVDISLKKTSIRTLDAVLFSRDVNAPNIRFNITKDGEELADSTGASLLLTASNHYGMLKDGLNIKLSGTVNGGEVTFSLPNDILSYEGVVRADLYIYWEDGSNDGTQPILFSVKRSALDSTASTMSVVYVDEFEIEKTRVTKAADDAIDTIDTNETIQQFEADKKAVSDAKDSAVTEINARPDELDRTIAETQTNIEAIPAELDSAVSTATTAIKAQSDSVGLSASNAKTQINTDVSAVDIATTSAQNSISNSVSDVSNAETNAINQINSDVSTVDNAKSTAIDNINSQTDLSTDASNAKTAISNSVSDVQTASASAVSDIEAVKPDMMQQINDIETNINELVVLQQQNAIQKKIQTAWAWSADGTDGFTTIYPNLNLLKNTRTLSATSTTTAWGILFTSSQIYDSTIKSKTGVSAMRFSFNVYVPLNAIAGSVVPIQLKGQNPQAKNVGTDGYNTILSNTDYVIKQIDLGKTIRVSIPIQKSINYQSFDTALADTASITIRQSSALSGFVYSTIKLEIGSTATPWMPSANEVTTADYPKYRGLGVLSSVTPTDYFWEQSDTYRDYKWLQLKEAIISLGGVL